MSEYAVPVLQFALAAAGVIAHPSSREETLALAPFSGKSGPIESPEQDHGALDVNARLRSEQMPGAID